MFTPTVDVALLQKLLALTLATITSIKTLLAFLIEDAGESPLIMGYHYFPIFTSLRPLLSPSYATASLFFIKRSLNFYHQQDISNDSKVFAFEHFLSQCVQLFSFSTKLLPNEHEFSHIVSFLYFWSITPLTRIGIFCLRGWTSLIENVIVSPS